MKDRIVKISTFLDPAKIGVLDFATESAKRGFHKKMRGRTTKWQCGEKTWFTNNSTIEKRIIDKTLGQVKHHLMDKGFEQKSIRIFWDTGIIKIKGVKVAEVKEDGELETYGDGDQVKQDVVAFMERWRNKAM